MEFSPDELKKIDEIKSHYPETKAALMPVLWLAQKKFGWLSNEALEYVVSLVIR